MEAELFLTNLFFAISFGICLALGIFVYVKRPKDGPTSANTVFLFFSLAVCIWQASYVLGINLTDPYQSRLAFMFNLVTLFLIVFQTHLVLILTDRLEQRKRFLWFLYAVSAAIVIGYLFVPDLFLLPSKPRLYLHNFFVPGPLYEVQDSFFFLLLVYLLIQIGIGYKVSDLQKRRKLTYYIVGLVYGYGVALVPELLLYGYNVDPLISSLTGLYTIPYAYAIIKYDVIDVRLVAKKAFGYSLSVVGVTLFILLVSYANNYIEVNFPNLPVWAVPMFLALISVVVGVIVWQRLKEVDILKYQFVDIVCHKFRTPLTHIRWSVDNLRVTDDPGEKTRALDQIDSANIKLFELTDMLVGLSNSETTREFYQAPISNLAEIIEKQLVYENERIAEKHLIVNKNIASNLPKTHIGGKNFEFVLQMILENATIYSKDGGVIEISAEIKKNAVDLAVRDFGIGISKENIHHIFARFFRGDDAMHAHTEGLGIGLHLSRNIMRQLGGDLYAESAGVGLGSTFHIIIPIPHGAK